LTLYYNECSQIPYATVQVANTRLAQKCEGFRQRAYYDLNPVAKTHWTYRLFQEHRAPDSMAALPDPENYASMYLNPSDNLPNLDPDYVRSLDQMSAKQRKRFFLGEYDTELEGALWSWEIIDPYRIAGIDIEWNLLVRIVVAIDPAVSSGQDADETGIIVAGLARSGHVVIIADLSGRYKPIEWARVAIAAYRQYRADRIVGERNNGGDMVESNIRAVDPLVPFRSVWASRGKAVRAEPVSSLYERGLVHHAGQFTALEDQLLSWIPSQSEDMPSPDRMDSLVYAISDLLLDTEEITIQTPLVQPYRIL
jgi:phage terminase large subunit-like protein